MEPWAKLVVVEVLKISVTAKAARQVMQMLSSEPHSVDMNEKHTHESLTPSE